MSDDITVKMATAWMPVNITGYDEAGRPLIFHPPCGESHPYIEGEILCPVHRDALALMREGYEKLFVPTVLESPPDSEDVPQSTG